LFNKKAVFNFNALGNYDSNDNTDTARVIMLAAIHVTVLHIYEVDATLYLTLKVRNTLTCLSLFWETLTSVKTDSGRNIHG
jgi:hypothetical protein